MAAVYSWDFAGRTRGGGPSGTGLIAGGDARITPSLALSRTGTLTAPIVMLFDASGTTTTLTGITDTFRQFEYYLDYGDSDGGTWAVTGLPKNNDIGGPVFAHLYASGQSVTANLRVRAGLRWAYQSNQGIATPYKQNDYCYVDPADPVNGTSFNTYKAANDHTSTSSFASDLAGGNWTFVQTGVIENSTSQSYTITSADTTFSGTNTVAINVVGDNDFSLAPSGSTHTNSNSALSPPADGIRHAYKGGSTFSGSISIPGNAGNTFRGIQIGSYGTGRAVISGGVTVGNGGNTTPLNGATVYGLDMGTVVGTSGTGSANSLLKNVLIWNCACTGIGSSWGNTDLSIVENTIIGTGVSTSDVNYNLYIGNGNDGNIDLRTVIMGNVANIATYHTIRWSTCQVGTASHNWFKGQCSASPGGEIFKLHQNTQQSTPQPAKATKLMVLRDNWVSDSSNTTMFLGIGAMPENNNYAEVLTDIIVERQHNQGAGCTEDFELGGVRMTGRGCTRVGANVSFTMPGSHTTQTPNGPPGNQLAAYNGPYFQV